MVCKHPSEDGWADADQEDELSRADEPCPARSGSEEPVLLSPLAQPSPAASDLDCQDGCLYSDDDHFSEIHEPGDTEVSPAPSSFSLCVHQPKIMWSLMPLRSRAQVIYVKEAVSVWPTRRETIEGRLTLIKQHQVMFLAWLPYTLGTLNQDGTFNVLPQSNPKSSNASSGEAFIFALARYCRSSPTIQPLQWFLLSSAPLLQTAPCMPSTPSRFLRSRPLPSTRRPLAGTTSVLSWSRG